MKSIKKCMILFLCILLITGCGKKNGKGEKGVSNTNSVEKTVEDQIKIVEQDSETETTETEASPDEIDLKETAKDTTEAEKTVDYDLTKMESDMVYATVYQMMVAPDEYEGKTFRIDGNFYATYYEVTKKYYFYCIIQDATACCAQGMEFVWEDGSHVYPDEYPKDDTQVVVEGTFETYKEDGDENLYCRLADATLKWKQ